MTTVIKVPDSNVAKILTQYTGIYVLLKTNDDKKYIKLQKGGDYQSETQF